MIDMGEFFFKNHKIALDLDEVVFDFCAGYSEYTGKDFRKPQNFDFSYEVNSVLKELPDEFWVNLPLKIKPTDLNFLPFAYVSKRNFDEALTRQAIEKNGLPCRPVYHVREKSKEPILKQLEVDIYVDDSIFNFQDLNSKGIKTYLMDASHNRQFDVGDYRLHHIRELVYKIEKHEISSLSN